MVAEAPAGRLSSRTPLSPLAALILAAAAALLFFFWDALAFAFLRWRTADELSHMFFIPAISAWLVWTNRAAVRASVGAPSLIGVGFLALALFLGLLGKVTHIYALEHLGVVAAIAGLVASYGGMSLLKATAAPIAFLLFAIPPPFWVQTVLSWKFMEMSSILGVMMIEAMNIPVYLSGNIIDLGEYKLQVAEACSGLRYLFPFLSIGVMAAYLYRGPLWGKALIVLSTIPITILMNSFRIAVTGALVQAYGTSHAEGALHFFEGWVVFLLCLVALLGVIAAIDRFAAPKRSPFEAIGAPELDPTPPSRSRLPAMAIAGAGAALALLAPLLATVVTTDELIIPERQSFAGVPAEFPAYDTEIRPLDPEVAETLGADDSIVMNLRAEDGQIYNIYMAYLEAQRDGRSWHSPRQCIPSGGWQIAAHEILDHPFAEDGHVNRLIIENRNARQLVYYWYDQRGRRMANETVMKFALMRDAIVRKRSDGALVRVLTPIHDEETIADADARLRELMGELYEVLPEYVPE